MAFKEFLFNHFPHRWLSITASGTNKLFTGLGNIFDWVEKYVDIAVRNNSTRTAVESLTELQNEYGLSINPSLDVEIQRAKIIIKKRQQDGCITKPQLIKMLEALHIHVTIVNFYNESVMEIGITSSTGFIYYNEIFEILNENIRAHVGFYLEMTKVSESIEYIAVFIEEYTEYEVNPKVIRYTEVGFVEYIALETEIAHVYEINPKYIEGPIFEQKDFTGAFIELNHDIEIKI